MADDNQAVINPDTVGQDAPMPSADQQTGPVTSAPVSAPQGEVGTGENSTGLPDDAHERTKREFDKLQQQLRDERARREYAEQAYQSMQPQQDTDMAPIYDPDTGLIDPDQLTDLQSQTIEANRRAERAEKAVENYMKTQEEREVFSVYPELDPKGDKHDKTFHVETRRIMLDSMVNPDDYDGQLSFKQAADLARKSVKDPEQARQLGAQQALEELTIKEQASLGAAGTAGRSRFMESEDLQNLQIQTRLGSKEAILERVRRLNDQ